MSCQRRDCPAALELGAETRVGTRKRRRGSPPAGLRGDGAEPNAPAREARGSGLCRGFAATTGAERNGRAGAAPWPGVLRLPRQPVTLPSCAPAPR